MEQREMPNGVTAESRVLAAGTAHGHRVEVIEYGDGSVAITLDGAEQAVYRMGNSNVESCINTYLKMLRADADLTRV
jgi:hypothetical protein